MENAGKGCQSLFKKINQTLIMVKILDDGQWSKFTIVVDGIVKGSRKKWIFYGQADRKGRWSTPLALAISKCENFEPFFIESWFFDTQNTLRSLWGLIRIFLLGKI